MQDDATAKQEAQMISTTVNKLFQVMYPYFSNFPNNYVVIDTETTGIRYWKGTESYFPDADLITQLGWCIVKNGRVDDQGSTILNWAEIPNVDHKKLKECLTYTKKQIEVSKDGKPSGRYYHMTYDLMKKHGINPVEGLKKFKTDILDMAKNNKMFLVAHNGIHFDARILGTHYLYWLKDKIKFEPNEMFDTGMVEKASQTNCTPWFGETVQDWSRRAYKSVIRGVKWSLDNACVARYKLIDRHYLPLDMQGQLAQAHDASFDCYVCHLLFETYKEIASGRRPEPPIPYSRINDVF